VVPPLVIFKGENFQNGWIPPDMDKDWMWTSNSKGWTCDVIAEEWIKRVFDPATCAKANGRQRALVCDGHGSHVQLSVIQFCIDNKISLLMMPPHSSHLCQPLDVGVFSPLKAHMSTELDKILRYGILSLKKFEWANAYRHARQKAMTESNIKSSWRAAGLFPFNRHKVLIQMPDFNEADIESNHEIHNATPPPEIHPFAQLPSTPSQVNSALLQQAGAALVTNIEAGIFDTPTRKVIPKLVAIAEFNTAQLVVSNYQNNKKDSILNKRREMSSGIRNVLKGKTLVSTEETYLRVQACKDATRNKKASRGRKRAQTTSSAPTGIMEVMEEVEGPPEDVIGDQE
jgi:DDE superfamily endonuclease